MLRDKKYIKILLVKHYITHRTHYLLKPTLQYRQLFIKTYPTIPSSIGEYNIWEVTKQIIYWWSFNRKEESVSDGME